MDKKRILLVSKFFYPTNTPRAFRTTELAKEFARLGHEVIVLTIKDNEIHSKFEREHRLKIKSLGNTRWKSIKLKGKGVEMLFRRLVRRFSDLLFQYPDIELMPLVYKALKHERNYDLAITIAVPYSVHWGMALARTQENPITRVWVADCGDPFMGQENDTFKPPFYFKYVEKWFCKKADFLTVPTDGAVKAYYPEFEPKIKVIPQGFKFEDIEVDNAYERNDIPVFGYAGGFIQGRRDPAELLQFLVSLDIDFIFHIYTNTPELVKAHVPKNETRILVHNFVPRKKLLLELSKMDFMINFENAGSKQTPSKLIDYVIIGKPILSVKTGALDKKVVKEFMNQNYTNQIQISNPDQYRIEKVCKKFLDLTT